MYRTCLFCVRDLGTNEILELLPVGRRLAFDMERGRLWVVCRGCERWNLVPFDSRLEVIEVCERIFRGTHLRYSTDNIGIARLEEGLELVRIGRPGRPEFAAWRYGDQFGSRRKRAIAVGVTCTAICVGSSTAGILAGASLGWQVAAFLSLGGSMVNLSHSGFKIWKMLHGPVVARLPEHDGGGGAVRSSDLMSADIARDGEGWMLGVIARRPGKRSSTRLRLTREQAVEALGFLLPAVNASGGWRRDVRHATAMVEELTPATIMKGAMLGLPRYGARRIGAIPLRTRLALEMSLHETSERRAMEGELALLERQWIEAARIAMIADDLAMPSSADEDLAGLRGRR